MIDRLKFLITGHIPGEDDWRVSWRGRWAVSGIHSYDWRWVRRIGRQDCGCIINPITRRRVGYRLGCDLHCALVERPENEN